MGFSNQLQKHRLEKGLSHDALAQQISVEASEIMNWEHNRSYPNLHNLLHLSHCFNTSLESLIHKDIAVMRDMVENEDGKSVCRLCLVLTTLTLLTLPLCWFGTVYLIAWSILVIVSLLLFLFTERMMERDCFSEYQEILGHVDHKDYGAKRNAQLLKSLRTLDFGFLVMAIIMLFGHLMN